MVIAGSVGLLSCNIDTFFQLSYKHQNVELYNENANSVLTAAVQIYYYNCRVSESFLMRDEWHCKNFVVKSESLRRRQKTTFIRPLSMCKMSLIFMGLDVQ